MNTVFDPEERNRLSVARDSFVGRLLTDTQFDDAIAITGILEREIRKSGTFKEKLGDIAHAFSRTERFDAMKAEEIIRDLFKARTGQTMNELRENLKAREDAIYGRTPEGVEAPSRDGQKPALTLSEDEQYRLYQAATEAGRMVVNGTKMSFYRALTSQAAVIASEFTITENGAKRLMSRLFEETEDRSLREWGKELDAQYFRPQIETAQAEQKPARARGRRRA